MVSRASGVLIICAGDYTSGQQILPSGSGRRRFKFGAKDKGESSEIETATWGMNDVPFHYDFVQRLLGELQVLIEGEVKEDSSLSANQI